MISFRIYILFGMVIPWFCNLYLVRDGNPMVLCLYLVRDDNPMILCLYLVRDGNPMVLKLNLIRDDNPMILSIYHISSFGIVIPWFIKLPYIYFRDSDPMVFIELPYNWFGM